MATNDEVRLTEDEIEVFSRLLVLLDTRWEQYERLLVRHRDYKNRINPLVAKHLGFYKSLAEVLGVDWNHEKRVQCTPEVLLRRLTRMLSS